MESPGDIEKLKIGEVPVYGKEQKITIYEVKSGSN
jgi:hypothetical protein